MKYDAHKIGHPIEDNEEMKPVRKARIFSRGIVIYMKDGGIHGYGWGELFGMPFYRVFCRMIEVWHEIVKEGVSS